MVFFLIEVWPKMLADAKLEIFRERTWFARFIAMDRCKFSHGFTLPYVNR